MPPNHSGPTRFLHGALAIAVGVQLLTGLIMQAPSARHAGNSFFTIHTDSDIIIAALALMFWGVIATRRIGTEAGLLFPWFTARRRAAFAADARRHWAALRHGRLAGFRPQTPLGAASHGIGLLLVTALAATGICHGVAALNGAADTPLFDWLQRLHSLTGILVWLFLIGHGVLALLHHYADQQDLQTIWSIGPGVANGSRRDDP